MLQPDLEIGEGRTNALGLRGPLPSESPALEGERRILFIGDSTCWGQGVTLEQSFAAHSVHLLQQANPERRVAWLNGCVPGHSSFQSRAMLTRLLPWAPDLVVFFVGSRNDHSSARWFRDAEIPERARRVEQRWHALRVLRLLEGATDVGRRWLLHAFTSQPGRVRVPPPAFRENLAWMLEAVGRSGANALLLVPPFSSELRRRHPSIPEYEARLDALAAATGTPIAHLGPIAAAHPEREVFKRDRVHLDRLGHRLVAGAIAEAVSRGRLLE